MRAKLWSQISELSFPLRNKKEKNKLKINKTKGIIKYQTRNNKQKQKIIKKINENKS